LSLYTLMILTWVLMAEFLSLQMILSYLIMLLIYNTEDINMNICSIEIKSDGKMTKICDDNEMR